MGENGPELEVTGPSRIWNANQTSAMLSGGSNDSESAAEIRALRDRVGNLEFALQAIAVNTGKMARILDAAQGEDGRSIMTSEAPTT